MNHFLIEREGVHRHVAVPRVREALEEKLPLPRALQCRVNAAIAFEKTRIRHPGGDRELHLPVVVFHLSRGGELSPVL